MAITEALSAVGGKSLFLAFVEIKGHHHLLKQKKEEMNLLFFPYCCHKHTYVCTYIQGNVNKDVAYESGSVRCWEQTGLLLSFENNASKASSIFRIIDQLVFSGLIDILKTKFCLHCVRQEVWFVEATDNKLWLSLDYASTLEVNENRNVKVSKNKTTTEEKLGLERNKKVKVKIEFVTFFSVLTQLR